MPRAKISEFSTIPGDNTDIDGINIAEGCAPSGINDAIRELMAQLKDFQSGAAGDNITVVGTLAAKGTSASGADLKLYEDTDNGTNYVGFIAPASIASNVQWTLPSADGSSGQALQTNGSGTLSFATLGISAGGTGQTTANAAFNALAPSQTSNAGRYLKTDGTNTSWDLLDISTADITGTLPVANGGTGITSFGTGVATALGINVGSSGAFVTNGGALGTPSSGTVTNLTGTASININGTVGATTPNTGSFTTLTTSSTVTINGGTANGVAYLNASKVLTTGSALTFDGTNLQVGSTSGSRIQFPRFSDNSPVLWVRSSSSVNEIEMRNNSGGGENYLKAGNGYLSFGVDTSEAMRLTSTGLGIGTSSPGYKLEVNGSGFASNWYGPQTAFTVGTVGGGVGLIGYGSTGVGGLTNTLLFQANGEKMRLDSSGNLGIGTSSPATYGKFVVDNTGAAAPVIYGRSGDQAGARIAISNTGAGGQTWQIVAGDVGVSNSGLSFYDGTATRARITSGGNFGIGTASPSGKLDVAGTNGNVQINASGDQIGFTYNGFNYITASGASATLQIQASGASGTLLFATAGSERSRITSGGDLLVGTTTAVAKVTVTNGSATQYLGSWRSDRASVQYFHTFNYNGTEIGSITGNNTNTAYNTSSDYRLKNIIGPITNSGAYIDALKPVEGTWKADGSTFVGLIAHEVQEVSRTNIATGTKDGEEMQGMDYSASEIIANLIAEVQSLRARVAQLEAK